MVGCGGNRHLSGMEEGMSIFGAYSTLEAETEVEIPKKMQVLQVPNICGSNIFGI